MPFINVKGLITVFLCALFMGRMEVSAQDIRLVQLKKINENENERSINVKKIIQDTYGFIWVGTQDGLKRYDGKASALYKKGDQKNAISGSDIKDLQIDSSQNLLWLAESDGGVDAIDLHTGSVVKRINEINNPELRGVIFFSISIFKDKLILASSNGLYQYYFGKDKIEKVEFDNKIDKACNFFIYEVLKDHNGNAWLFCRDEGIFVIDKNLRFVDFMPAEKVAGQQNINFFDCDISRSGDIAFASDKGPHILRLNKRALIEVIDTAYVFPGKFKSSFIFSCKYDGAGNLFFSSDEALYKFNSAGKKLEVFKESNCYQDDSWLKSVYTLFFDEAATMWIGCHKGLANLKNKPGPFLAFNQSSQSKEKISYAYNIYCADNSTAYISAEDGLFKVNTQTDSIAVLRTGKSFFYFLKGPFESTILSNSDGVFLVKGKEDVPIEKIFPEFKPFAPFIINSHCIYKDSLLIFGTENNKGVIVWDFKNHKAVQLAESSGSLKIKENVVNNIYLDYNGKLVILGDKYISVYYIETNKISSQPLNIPGKDCSLFFDIVRSRNKYYIASYGSGVVVLDSSFRYLSLISEKNGLANNGVYKLFIVGDSSLIITSNDGVSVFNLYTGKDKNYFENEGLHGNNFEERCGTFYNNKIYAGGVNGFTIMDPAKFIANPEAPRIYINKIIIDTKENKIDTSDLEIAGLTVPNNVLQTTIFLSGINWSNPERLKFAYRIRENGNDWVNIGTQDFINFIGLSHGTYHLQVKACNEDGIWSEPTQLVLEYLPKWYQTWWFKLLVFLVTVSVIYAFYRYRIAQIKKQHEIRKNIATDLHDDLGSTLNSVKVFTNLAISGVNQHESLQQIKDNLNEATIGLRDMIWVLDDSLDTVDELVTRLKQFALPVAAASNTEAIIKADSDVNNIKLTKEEKRNLFLVCKEAINNSIKYSGATQITISIVPEHKKIKISITDNGKGFNAEEVKKGYGLKNMQYRAGQVKYKTNLTSVPGKGTALEIKPV